MLEETESETPLVALPVPGSNMRQPRKTTAAMMMPIVRYMRARLPPVSAAEGQVWRDAKAH